MSGTVAVRSTLVDQPTGSGMGTRGGAVARIGVTDPVPNRSNPKYWLDVRQQPRQARMAGSGEKADRRTVDPPPIIRLRIRRPSARRKSLHSLTDDDLVSPTLTHTHFCFASLVPENSEEELYELAGSKSKYVGGSVVSSLFHLKDQSCFVFPDLSVKTEGRWRFKMSLYEIVEDGVLFCDSVVTDVFQVYSSKKFPGMRQSTELSKSLAQQGLKLRIRRPDTNEPDSEETDLHLSRRKRSKATPRQRTSLTHASWSSSPVVVPAAPPAGTGRRISGPTDLLHTVPLVAPIGSTTSTPQQPWSSWNCAPAKIDSRHFPDSYGGFSSPSRTSLPSKSLQPTPYEYRQLPQLDERNTAPDPNFHARLPFLPRMPTLSTTVVAMDRTSNAAALRMPPPLPPRESPETLSRAKFSSSGGTLYAERLPTLTSGMRPLTPPTVLAPIRSGLLHPTEPATSPRWLDPAREIRDTPQVQSKASSVTTTTSDETGKRGHVTSAATSVSSSESGGTSSQNPTPSKSLSLSSSSSRELDPEGGSPRKDLPGQPQSNDRVGKGNGGSLARLLGEGATHAKQIDNISFF